MLVNPFLQSVSHPRLFAVGDCITFDQQKLPKAGVYSVREVGYFHGEGDGERNETESPSRV